ncbi:pathogenesis-related protein 1C-like isoform X1 [Cucurbita maxima]|uniref:Pathogenesis-related protein 1C-like isoform X1 n=1 Tax=Cucurbita maxima TaxID=3661 RepID=A0A6J1JLM6_CUCMA|nr:pathogenesis-related protein 1C-like isoform X1 [Cucurbita maxima]
MAMAMAIKDEDYTALLPFGLTSDIIGCFIPDVVSLSLLLKRTHLLPTSMPTTLLVPKLVLVLSNGMRSWQTTPNNMSMNASMTANWCTPVGLMGRIFAWGMPDLTATNAVKLWVDEKQFNNYATNSCDSGSVCTHYTQVVWRNSIRIGRTRVECNNACGVLITCNYNLHGNVVGQRPY